MACKKYTPVDDYTGDPDKVAYHQVDNGVELTTEQWPTLVCKFTMSIPAKLVDLTDLQFNGWEPNLVGERVILKHRGTIANGWCDMIMREFVKEATV